MNSIFFSRKDSARPIFPKFCLFRLFSFWNEPTKNNNLLAKKTNFFQTDLHYETVLKYIKISSLEYLA